MSDIMRLIPFAQMMDSILTEHANLGSVFGVRKIVRHEGGADPIFNEKIESPFGPAAGPNSQLAQNIVASYVAGSRFFEVKTVQVMDGASCRVRQQAPASWPRTSATTGRVRPPSLRLAKRSTST